MTPKTNIVTIDQLREELNATIRSRNKFRDQAVELQSTVNRLSEAFRIFTDQATAQFRSGDRYATFNRETVNTALVIAKYES